MNRAAFVVAAVTASKLQDDVTKVVQEIAEITKVGISFAYKAADEEFTVAAGSKILSSHQEQFKYAVGVDIDEFDHFLIGSATKAFVGTAVMKLHDQGKLDLDTPVHTYIDPILKRDHNKTMHELFGHYSGAVTVRQLVFMQSGLQNYDTKEQNDLMIQDRECYRVHDPFEAL